MPRIQLEDQDAVLLRLGMWPFAGRTLDQLTKEERTVIYKRREKLSGMAKAIRLPGVKSCKYRTSDIDALIQRNEAA